MCSLMKRRTRRDRRAASQHLKGSPKEEGVRLFSKAPEDRTRSNGWKLNKERSNLELRRNFLTVGTVDQWNRSCLQKLWMLQHWEQFAVFRGLDGKVYVLDAYCPHLGANLAVGGHVVGNCLECPFHGWIFSGKDGSCVKIPYAKRVPEFATTKVWQSCEINNMIMVWYHCDGTSPAWQVAEREETSSPKWVFRAGTEHFVSTHIEEIPENAADVAHLNFLHNPSVISGNDLRFTDNHRWAFFKHTWEAQWQPEPEPDGHCSVMRLTHHVLLFGKPIAFLDLNVSARQIGPGLVTMVLSHAFLGKALILQTVTPLEPLLQHVVHEIYFPHNVPSFLAKLILWAEGVQFERDIMIWNNKRFLSKPLLVKEDAAILRHRRWFSQFYSQNSREISAQKEPLDW